VHRQPVHHRTAVNLLLSEYSVCFTYTRIDYPEDSCLRQFNEKEEDGIPFNLKDYLELVDWGG